MFKSKWLKYFIGVFSMTFLLSLIFGEETIAAEYSPRGKGIKNIAFDTTNRDQKIPQFYRFDDMLDDAVLTEASNPMVDENEIKFDFDEADAKSWRPVDERYVTTSAEKGLLEITIKDKITGIENADDLKIIAEKNSGIVLRMKVSKGDYFKLMWKRTEDKDFRKGDFISVKIPENDKFLVYKIKTSNLHGWKGKIDRIRLYPTDREDSKIELDYIIVLTENSYFSSQKVGVDKYEIDSEVRRVIFSHSPSSIKYKITVPSESFLSFGVAVLDPNITTNFEVLLETNGDKERIYTKRVREKKWNDVTINMSKWRGKDVLITFRTSSMKVGNLAFWSNPLIWQREKQPNVIIYLIDCLGSQHVSAYGYKRDTTPHIDNFSKEGALFLNAYSQSTWTRPSVTSLMTSQYVSAHKVDGLGKRLPKEVNTIAKGMRNRGYRTVLINDNKNAGVESNLDQGFEQVFLKGLSGNDDRMSKSLSSVITWLKNNVTDNDRNFFLYLHTLELHAPYIPPKPYDKLYGSDYRGKIGGSDYDPYKQRFNFFGWRSNQRDIDHLIALYDGLINFADERFSKLIDILKELKVYDNTLLIVTADHGETFNAHDQWTHGGHPYQDLIRVPVIMRFPPLIPAGKIITEDVQLIDIAPTVLDIVGLKPSEDFQGVSLLPLVKNQNIGLYKNRNVYSEGKAKIALVKDRYKFIMSRPVNNEVNNIKRIFINYILDYINFWKVPDEELYDLENDPGEKYNLSARQSSKSTIYKKNILEWLEVQNRIYKGKTESESTDIKTVDPKVQEELKALGYIE